MSVALTTDLVALMPVHGLALVSNASSSGHYYVAHELEYLSILLDESLSRCHQEAMFLRRPRMPMRLIRAILTNVVPQHMPRREQLRLPDPCSPQ
jgi:hypothetical protein